jgi:glycerol-3-phosphate acyltransferase PlsY
MLAPAAVLIAAAIFLIVVIVSRYVSLGSILAVASFPPLIYKTRGYGNSRAALVFIVSTSLLIILRHHENIRRLLAGTEPRIGARGA